MNFAATVRNTTLALRVSSDLGNCRRCTGITSFSALTTSICAVASWNFKRSRFDRRYSPGRSGNSNPYIYFCSDATSISSPALRVVEGDEEVSVIVTSDGYDADDQPQTSFQSDDSAAILSACAVGLFTGLAVVFFNYAVHEIRDLCWGGIPDRGASWLREEPLELKFAYVVLIPTFGGLLVSLLNMTRSAVEDSTDSTMSGMKASIKPILKTLAACLTLGTGNSLGPEGPSVEIGVSVAKAIGTVFDKGAQKKLSLRAAGSAAGLSSGFNAAVAGCFFAVESVLWPSPAESTLSLTNATSMVILSAVIASVISEVGLGSEPAFTVPVYEFVSPSELPLYLLLGLLCGLVSLCLSKFTSFMLVAFDDVQRSVGIPKAAFPIVGGLAVGLIALAYPEILYWGFQNVDTLLESRPLVNGLSADLLLQLVAAKILASSLCRASGLVGGYYAPSLFIGASTGMAYGKLLSSFTSISDPIFHISILEVASPKAYGLVGMAATLAGVCQVPLTAVLLLFELTQDYRIVLPLLGAVGLSSWITSDGARKAWTSVDNVTNLRLGNSLATSLQNPSYDYSLMTSADAKELNGKSIFEIESSLCLNDGSDDDAEGLASEILVSQAMRTRYLTIMLRSYLMDVVSLMLEEKQSYAMIVDNDNRLIGHLTVRDIQQSFDLLMSQKTQPQAITVSDLCSLTTKICSVSCAVTPETNLLSAIKVMNEQGMSHLPVIMLELEAGNNHIENRKGVVVGVLDRESIDLTTR